MCDLKLHTLWSSIKTDGYIGIVGQLDIVSNATKMEDKIKKESQLFPDGTGCDSFLFRYSSSCVKCFVELLPPKRILPLDGISYQILYTLSRMLPDPS